MSGDVPTPVQDLKYSLALSWYSKTRGADWGGRIDLDYISSDHPQPRINDHYFSHKCPSRPYPLPNAPGDVPSFHHQWLTTTLAEDPRRTNSHCNRPVGTCQTHSQRVLDRPGNYFPEVFLAQWRPVIDPAYRSSVQKVSEEINQGNQTFFRFDWSSYLVIHRQTGTLGSRDAVRIRARKTRGWIYRLWIGLWICRGGREKGKTAGREESVERPLAQAEIGFRMRGDAVTDDNTGGVGHSAGGQSTGDDEHRAMRGWGMAIFLRESLYNFRGVRLEYTYGDLHLALLHALWDCLIISDGIDLWMYFQSRLRNFKNWDRGRGRERKCHPDTAPPIVDQTIEWEARCSECSESESPEAHRHHVQAVGDPLDGTMGTRTQKEAVIMAS
ncbi:hypothetical protein B0H16DRAFT_1480703 [Mycena metata]|uniref:Uncharacterized protein n=1 Tax=Mycena metata TaxID=1033252 RepID=A0AAD7H256_9AGAR|nr:hypothetical protein B0H16DRAFT_1480703 [Mycena metata]